MNIEFRTHGAIAQIALAWFAALATACVADVAPGPDRPAGDDVTYGDQVHAMPMQSSGVHTHAAAGAHLTYYGGKVVQNMSVIQVLYGSGTYISELNATGPGSA